MKIGFGVERPVGATVFCEDLADLTALKIIQTKKATNPFAAIQTNASIPPEVAS